MKTDIVIPKELLATYDLMNTINGGMAETMVRAWQEKDGYQMYLEVPGVELEKIRIEAENQRFVIYYTIDVLEGKEQAPIYLANLPLSPNVDVNGITAHIDGDAIHIFAPFNDWAKGTKREIDLER